jgi:hypothetical protein
LTDSTQRIIGARAAKSGEIFGAAIRLFNDRRAIIAFLDFERLDLKDLPAIPLRRPGGSILPGIKIAMFDACRTTASGRRLLDRLFESDELH